MFLNRFFGKASRRPETARRVRQARRHFAAAAIGRGLEPLEDRALLSIAPNFVGPLAHNTHFASPAEVAQHSTTGTAHGHSDTQTGEGSTDQGETENDTNETENDGSTTGTGETDSSGSETDGGSTSGDGNGGGNCNGGSSSSSSDGSTSGGASVSTSVGASVAAAASTNAASAATASHFVVLVPAGATIGTPVTVQLLAESANNHLATGYDGTADLSSSDAGATLPATVTFNHGHATIQVTFATAGQQNVTATDSADGSITGTATTNVVTPDVATHFVLSMPSGATAGKPVTVQVVAEDAQNFPVKDYDGTADVSSSDGGATLPASLTFKNGHASFQVTFATPGLQTVTATDSTTSSLTGTASTNVATPAAATHFVLYMSQGVSIGSPTTVQIVAEDAQNHEVSSYNGTANLTSSDPGATLPATVTFNNGEAHFQVTFATGNQQTVTATDQTDATLTGSATTNVAIPHYLMIMPKGVTQGVPVTVQLVAEDDQNHLLSTYAGTANLTSTDGAAKLPASVTFAAGKASFQVTFNTLGQQSVTATDSTSSTPVGTATTNVAAPDVATHFVLSMPSGATVGTPVTVRLIAEDAQNHIVPNFTGTVNLTSSDAGATLPVSIAVTGGQATFFQVTFATTGVQTVTATDSANASLAGTASTTVAAPAVATHFVVRMRPGVELGAPVTVQVVAEDAENHVVSNYSGTADLSSSDGSATLPTSVTFKNGKATFQVTFATTGQQNVTVTDSVNPSVTGTATTNVSDKSSGRVGWSGGNVWRDLFARFRHL